MTSQLSECIYPRRIEQGVFFTICQMVGELKILDDKRKYVKKYSKLLMSDTKSMNGMSMNYDMSPYVIFKEILFIQPNGIWGLIPTGIAVYIKKNNSRIAEDVYHIQNYRDFKMSDMNQFKKMVERLCLEVL